MQEQVQVLVVVVQVAVIQCFRLWRCRNRLNQTTAFIILFRV